jgi:hypothetical protein
MRRSGHLLKFAGVLAVLFATGIVLGLGYEWYHGTIVPAQFFTTAAGNAAPSQIGAPATNAPTAANPAESVPLPLAKPNSETAADTSAPGGTPPQMLLPRSAPNTGQGSNAQVVQPQKAASQANSNVAVLNPVVPLAAQPTSRGGELTLPQGGSSQGPGDRLPAIGSQGQTIWVPRAIEGCWAGTGDSSLQYLGGCPNIFSTETSPVKLRWCFSRIGDRPLELIMARGQYPGRVSQRWEVTGAQGQTIDLRETIGYRTMMFMHVVDVGDWTCHISADDQLFCTEHELARCGPSNWLQAPWFRGSGEVTARRAGERNSGRRIASEP